LTATEEAYDHKAYYPGAQLLQIRVTGDERTGKLLGAQIAGNWKADVAGRVDTFATALFHDMDIDELNALDLSYTPPLGSPWDAVQVAAQAWTARRRSITN
jgi:NADPH-dependent 2,4-dienoyl-CoA reductase/sulfur reductase-like enzyme